MSLSFFTALILCECHLICRPAKCAVWVAQADPLAFVGTFPDSTANRTPRRIVAINSFCWVCKCGKGVAKRHKRHKHQVAFMTIKASRRGVGGSLYIPEYLFAKLPVWVELNNQSGLPCQSKACTQAC